MLNSLFKEIHNVLWIAMLMDESIEKENKNKIRTENDSHCLIIGSFFNPQKYRVIVKIVAKLCRTL